MTAEVHPISVPPGNPVPLQEQGTTLVKLPLFPVGNGQAHEACWARAPGLPRASPPPPPPLGRHTRQGEECGHPWAHRGTTSGSTWERADCVALPPQNGTRQKGCLVHANPAYFAQTL